MKSEITVYTYTQRLQSLPLTVTRICAKYWVTAKFIGNVRFMEGTGLPRMHGLTGLTKPPYPPDITSRERSYTKSVRCMDWRLTCLAPLFLRLFYFIFIFFPFSIPKGRCLPNHLTRTRRFCVNHSLYKYIYNEERIHKENKKMKKR